MWAAFSYLALLWLQLDFVYNSIWNWALDPKVRTHITQFDLVPDCVLNLVLGSNISSSILSSSLGVLCQYWIFVSDATPQLIKTLLVTIQDDVVNNIEPQTSHINGTFAHPESKYRALVYRSE